MEEQNNYFNYAEGMPNQITNTSGEGLMDSLMNGLFNPTDTKLHDNVFSRWLHPEIAEMKQFERENYLMDKGNAFNEYMFDKANEWNSAAAQMQRGKEAGINPMLLAAGISGSGATATPMQSQGASAGMNNNAESPFSVANQLMQGLETGTNTIDKIGKLIGFGKQNKADIKLANETAKKTASETSINWHNFKRLEKTYQDFIRGAKADADAAEKHVKELQALIDKYNAEKELIDKQKNLVDEQVNTQEEITKEERLKRWELEFKKKFRDTFGVQLNDSDTSMLMQMVLNGHGEQIVTALTDMLSSLGRGLGEAIKGTTNNTSNINGNDIFFHKYPLTKGWLEEATDFKDEWKRQNAISKAERKWWREKDDEKKRWNNNKDAYMNYWARKYYGNK